MFHYVIIIHAIQIIIKRKKEHNAKWIMLLTLFKVYCTVDNCE